MAGPQPRLRVRLLGGRINRRGLAPAPFFISRTDYFPRTTSPHRPPKTRRSGGVPLPGLVGRKKVSGRWGCRPLWRGGWRVLSWKVGRMTSAGPAVQLRSPAAEQRTGARSLRSFPPARSRTKLPTTRVIVPNDTRTVSRSVGSIPVVLLCGTFGTEDWYLQINSF